MTNRPTVNPGDWIKVANLDCVVAVVRQPDQVAFSGDLEVVFDAQKPTNPDVEWNGEAWLFCKRPDYGGYAAGKSRLSQAVGILRLGRNRR
jgi:hypothetical protein